MHERAVAAHGGGIQACNGNALGATQVLSPQRLRAQVLQRGVQQAAARRQSGNGVARRELCGEERRREHARVWRWRERGDGAHFELVLSRAGLPAKHAAAQRDTVRRKQLIEGGHVGATAAPAGQG